VTAFHSRIRANAREASGLPDAPTRGTSSSSWWVLLLLGLITVAQLIFAASYPPLDDEAYYWTWARHLAWGYPDHPPMIAYVIRATTALVGDTSLGIRMGPALLGLGTALLLWDLVRRMFGNQAAAAAALWYQLIPVFSLSAVFAAPDAPLGLFWMLTMWCFWRALKSGATANWLATGLALGLALLSKLTAVFLALALPAFLLTSPTHRRWLRRPEPYLAAAVSLAMLAPLIVWNAQHDWLLFQKSRTPIPWTQVSAIGGDALVYTAAQLGYYGPVAAVLLLTSLAATIRPARGGDERFALAVWSGVPIIAVNWLASFQGVPKPHWPAPGYLAALIPAAAFWLRVRTRRAWRALVGVAIALNLIIVGAIHVFPLRPTPSLAGALYGWDQVAARLETLVRETPSNHGVFILVGGYQSAAQVEYHTRGQFVVTTGGTTDAFAVRRSLRSLEGWNAIAISDLPNASEPPLAGMFARTESLPPIEVAHNGYVVRRFAVYRCFGFRGATIPSPPP